MKRIIALAVVQKWGDYMKAILLSIKPQYCELIAGGKKTIEVRKSKPKLKAPFKCYIYCTKQKRKLPYDLYSDELYRLPKGEIKYGCSIELSCYSPSEYSKDNFLNGKVIGEFVCDGIIDLHDNGNEFVNPFNSEITELLMPFSCLSYKELHDYANGKQLYGWHISNLKIYDKPKELSEFRKPGGRQCVLDNGRCCKYIQAEPDDDPGDQNTMSCIYGETNCPFEHLNRPPQSWCYVGEVEK